MLPKAEKIALGESFESFEAFQQALHLYESQEKQKFTIKNSRKIAAAHVTYKIEPELIYYELEYGCIHRGGFRKSGKNLRKSSTVRMSCSAIIKLRASKCGKKLIIRDFKEKHIGHELTTKVVDHLNLNRKFNEEELHNIQQNIALGADKKQIQNMFLTKGDKKPVLKDLRNIQYSMKKNNDNKIENIVNILQNSYDSKVSVLCSHDNTFNALYFSTPVMRNNMQAWPEFIAIDGTYKLMNNGCTLFLLIVEDSDGHSEIVGICIAANEEKDTLSFFLNCFKEEHINVIGKIKCFMGDKDLLERDVLKEVFPGVSTYLCLFHTLKSFKREITTEKMNITKKQRDECLEYLQKLAYSSCNDEYELILNNFRSFAPQSVQEYFDKNWGNIKDEWAIFAMSNNFLNYTNNRIESLNQKIKQVVKKNADMIEFIKNFFVFFYSQRHERNHHIANHILKRPVPRFEVNSPEGLYESYLTRYAFQHVLKQLQESKVQQIISKNENAFLVRSFKKTINVTSNSCECQIYLSMLLPCKHIFLVREKLNLSLYCEKICDKRWSREYYLKKHNFFEKEFIEGNSMEVGPSISRTEKRNIPLSVPQKRKIILTVTNSLASLSSLSCNSIFEYRHKILKEIELAWKQGKEVTLGFTDMLPSSSAQLTDNELENCNPSMELTGQILTEKIDITEKHINDVQTIEENPMSNMERNLNLIEDADNKIDTPAVVLAAMHMPANIKKRGRPKGADLTVIGLKKKRKCGAPKTFIQKSPEAKAEIVLSWILTENNKEKITSILQGNYLILKSDLHMDPERINNAILDDTVDVSILESYVDEKALSEITSIIQRKRNAISIWNCGTCQKPLCDECIRCDGCLQWYHFYCVGLLKTPQRSQWFCIDCYTYCKQE